MKKILFFVLFLLVSNLIFAQTETQIVGVQFSSSSESPILNDQSEEVPNVNSSFNVLEIYGNYGHSLGKRWEMLYNLSYKGINTTTTITDENSLDTNFTKLPSFHYEIPTYELISSLIGIYYSMKNNWTWSNIIQLSATNDFTGNKLKPFIFNGILTSFEKQKNENFSFGFGLFFNRVQDAELETKILALPVFNLTAKNDKHGVQLNFPESLRVWQKTTKNSFIELKSVFDSYSLTYEHIDTLDETISNTVYSINNSLTFNYILDKSIQLSAGIAAPLQFYSISENDKFTNYSILNATSLQFGVSLLLSEE